MVYDTGLYAALNRLTAIELDAGNPPDLRRLVSNDRQALSFRIGRGDNSGAWAKVAEVRAYLVTWGVSL